ncbi:LacI family transcriptional regulator [Fontibacillus phaseoli]|uniref:LacI family transcriptional regulator n=1 Tax=Fontibacillus phaseoli TaxID=1416533 RepID=A0A369BFW1_9BACL|nr:LacI family DNA-binding transcriptional regulator [Fontibacillus phaseoli]RCX18584.1 LacI family transcriptional regulator [Fontibacillus phaseoli]
MNIFDIAKLAGVSRKTVQRVLNNSASVSPKTRENVLRVMEEYHYEPNSAARKLSSKKAHTIGLFIIQDTSNYRLYSDDLFYGVAIGAVISQCFERGYNTLVTILDISDTSALFSQYKQKNIDGGIVISWSNLQELVEQVRDAGFEICVFDRSNAPDGGLFVPAPRINNRKGAYKAIEYLAELGHMNIGIVTGLLNNLSGLERYEGYLEAMQAWKLPVSQAQIFQGDFTENGGYAAVEHWISEGTLPTAVFCSNDLTAIGAMKALAAHKWSVPDDISVIGFDDLLISQYLHPALTTMHVPRVDMAVSLVNQLISVLEEDSESLEERSFEVELIVRDSCSTPKI